MKQVRIFEYTIKDEHGIHARPAGMLAKLAKGFTSEITIARGEKSASCTKLIALMGLGIKCGDTITVTVRGEDETQAELAVKEFLQNEL